MSITNQVRIEQTSVIQKFDAHLSNPTNKRILFSAPFGAGKSTFLRDYFVENGKYITLKLYPVNYTVAANQDVFELVKYDLLYELLSNYPKEINLQKQEFSDLLVSQIFILNKLKIDLPLKAILKAASIVPKGSVEAYDELSGVLNNFSSYRKDIEEDELDMLKKYIQLSKNKEGHLYEFDEISQLIYKMIDRVKEVKKASQSTLVENTEEIQTILIIDDLDRLDPEHVFRLFNIFTAHYDEINNENKFGFDKVIFVCDVNNIQQMFNHKYGLNVEFSGYIDKFYSSEIFKFDIKTHFKETIKKLVTNKLKLDKHFPKGLKQEIANRYTISGSNSFYDTFEYVIINLIDQNILRIRNFDRFSNYSIPNYTFKINSRNIYNSAHFPLLVLVGLLTQFFPRVQDLENAIKNLYLNFDSDYDEMNRAVSKELDVTGTNIIEFSLQFLLDDKKTFLKREPSEGDQCFLFKNETGKEISVIYQITYDHFDGFSSVNFIKCTNEQGITNKKSVGNSLVKPNPFWFLYNAIIVCKTKNLLEN